MTGRQTSATERALARVRAGQSAYSAARAEGIALSTIYRALKRLRAIAAQQDVEAYSEPPERSECPHGLPWTDCAACLEASDHAFDSAREGAYFQR